MTIFYRLLIIEGIHALSSESGDEDRGDDGDDDGDDDANDYGSQDSDFGTRPRRGYSRDKKSKITMYSKPFERKENKRRTTGRRVELCGEQRPQIFL